MTASTSDALIMLESVCQDHHFGIGEYPGVDSVTSALVRHCVVNVTVLALRLMGKVEFTLADKSVVFAISQFHYSSVTRSIDFSSDEKHLCPLFPSYYPPAQIPANIH